MPENRFFADHLLDEKSYAILTDQEHHHLVHVMRVKVGQEIEIVNGQGVLALANVIAIEKKQTKAYITQHKSIEKRSTSPKILIQALPLLNRADLILEKGTELGIDAIWFFPGEKSERRMLNDHQKSRMEGIVLASMKQCGRLFATQLSFLPPICDWTKELVPYLSFFGDLSPQAPPFSLINKKTEQGICFVIGPESGFSEREKDHLRLLGIEGRRIHTNTLRTETAAIVAMTLLSF